MKLFKGLKGSTKTAAVIGTGAIGVIALLWAMSNLVKPGRGKSFGPLPWQGSPFIPPALGGGGGPPMKAHLANMIPPVGGGHPARSTLGVGGRIAGGLGSGGGMYRWPSGRIGHRGGYGVASGYYATT